MSPSRQIATIFAVFKSLSVPGRLSIVMVLADGNASLVAIAARTGLKMPWLHHALRDLRSSKLIVSLGKGRYGLNPVSVSFDEDTIYIDVAGYPIVVGRHLKENP